MNKREPSINYEYSVERIQHIRERLDSVLEEFYSSYADCASTGRVQTIKNRIKRFPLNTLSTS
jgi:hypothetical protein